MPFSCCASSLNLQDFLEIICFAFFFRDFKYILNFSKLIFANLAHAYKKALEKCNQEPDAKLARTGLTVNKPHDKIPYRSVVRARTDGYYISSPFRSNQFVQNLR